MVVVGRRPGSDRLAIIPGKCAKWYSVEIAPSCTGPIGQASRVYLAYPS